ncbi:MAG: hypothetical protein CSA35_01525 [Dethiosulfovibrio peptidovorans]|nr:MAG: hypothetical protein CSA35_01525 [Dethiosulfovibrio peptidovorans]
MSDGRKALRIAVVFGVLYWLPVESPAVQAGAVEALAMVRDYAREHVLLCLLPAFLIAGAISVFVSSQTVTAYLGARAKRWIAYSIAAVSGSILAVCSCTVLPLFAGIYRRGAGLGPATAFLYSGPAINVLSIALTARVLGFRLGVVRALGAVVFSVVIGLSMAVIFRLDEDQRQQGFAEVPDGEQTCPLWQTIWHVGSLVAFLILANWATSPSGDGVWDCLYRLKWILAGIAVLSVVVASWAWLRKEDLGEWLEASLGFAVQVLPLLLMGVLLAGFLFGRPGHQALISERWVSSLVGGNSLRANVLAALSGAFMYVATLTEVPILQGLLGAGMGQGPALALLLAGPALSLPNMLVIRSLLGTAKTVTYVGLVVALSSLAGLLYGWVTV